MSDISPNARSQSISDRPHLPDAMASFCVQALLAASSSNTVGGLGPWTAHGYSQHGSVSGYTFLSPDR
jgi:hypothetical protein